MAVVRDGIEQERLLSVVVPVEDWKSAVCESGTVGMAGTEREVVAEELGWEWS